VAILIAFAPCGMQKKQEAGIECVFIAQCEKPIIRQEKKL